jgi:hypothetical protein
MLAKMRTTQGFDIFQRLFQLDIVKTTSPSLRNNFLDAHSLSEIFLQIFFPLALEYFKHIRSLIDGILIFQLNNKSTPERFLLIFSY